MLFRSELSNDIEAHGVLQSLLVRPHPSGKFEIIAGERRNENMTVLMDLCEVMADASLCAMGGFTPLPVRSAIAHFVDSTAGAHA